jgi:hypothetical protein
VPVLLGSVRFAAVQAYPTGEKITAHGDSFKSLGR